ncbi:hypothetical protein R2217_002859 [Cronobacter turicensis]|nr:hypothetical protein [Cronobacter turicensis]ELQ6076697.1 hypothetical protein [Cronobacter turicensis]ELQ6185130.1 hypothetical protein [Cronobacter turicensis]ELQ6232204.1 hypothetical protein [Cronobacter turicensis]ELQ6236367.1 hypothetical protein [Cronobacter turicensis]
MNPKLNELKEKLDNLHTALDGLQFQSDDLIDLGAYTFPFLHSTDLVYFPKMLSEKISKMGKYEPSNEDLDVIDSLIYDLDRAQPNIDHITHGNSSVSQTAVYSYLLSMLYISIEINELFSFAVLKDKDLLPKKIISRLELYHSGLASIEEKSGSIEGKIKTINEAYDAAENLPTTLKMLRDTNQEIDDLKRTSSSDYSEIEKKLKLAQDGAKEIEELKDTAAKLSQDAIAEAKDYLSKLRDEAQTYIDRCEEAFRTTTSKGLAGAFQDKAEKLNLSIRYWVGGLIAALIAGACVGYLRLNALETYLSNPDSSGVKLAIQLILSFLSVGAPLWFAWLSTKQIGQRFRLAEDYEFKASVSKAYEGYRREAVQLDSDFSQRLFGNALTRLEEPPLRFVEEKTHSSPIMEMLSSDNFRKIVDDGGEKMDAILEKAGLVKRKNVEKAEVVKPVESAEED